MIRIALTTDGLCAPQVFCDQCGLRIERAEDGNYEWFIDHDGSPTQTCGVFFTHKECSHTFEVETGRSSYSEELAALPIFLGDGLSLDWPKARERAARAADL